MCNAGQQNCQNKTCWRNNYFTRKDRKNIKWINASIIKLEHYKMSKLLNDSIVSKFVTKNGLKKMMNQAVNIL